MLALLTGHFGAIGVHLTAGLDALIRPIWPEGTIRDHLDGGMTWTWRDATGASIIAHVGTERAPPCGAELRRTARAVLGTTIDCVFGSADAPELLQANVVQGTFWLMGRLPPPA